MSVTVDLTAATIQQNGTKAKRTNSLGWATSDCHRCSSLGRQCNRQRPRCSACLADGIVCAGYVQQLDWERGKSRKGKSARKGPTKRLDLSKSIEAIAQLPQPTEFTFVTSQSKTPSRSRKRSIDRSHTSKEATPDTSEVDRRNSTSTTYDSPAQDSSSPWTLSRTGSPLLGFEANQFTFSIPQRIYRHPGAVEDSLSFYHECFSHTTLTFPVQVNPWQAAITQIHDDIPCVRYAAVAVARRQQAHLDNRPESLSVLQLKDRALSIFGTRLKDVSLESGVSTALLLFALDYVESGYSSWAVHLRGAYKILESGGGITQAKHNPNLRSQIAMLLWYDVTAAMLSRCGLVFPRTYLETLMVWQSEDEWSMLALNGLPDDMFLDMYDLAAAAQHPETLTPMEIFDMQSRVSTIFINTHGNDYFYSMSQSWKLGLLLYCSRVFAAARGKPSSGPTKPERFTHPSSVQTDIDRSIWWNPHELAVRVLEHVEALPPHSSLQKQCLLPIMLAGCEVLPDESELRQIVVGYGERWKSKTGMWLWNSGSEFLSAVWAVNQQNVKSGRPSASWTDVFPPSADHGFLFG